MGLQDKQLLQQVYRRFGRVIRRLRHVIFEVQDATVHFLQVIARVKGRLADQELVEHNADRPKVHLVPVATTGEKLRS